MFFTRFDFQPLSPRARVPVLFLLRRRDVELEMDDIAILNDVRFTFLSVFPGGFHFRHRIRR